MSVLKEHRTQSKAEFINKAINIEIYTIAFLSKMSIKFQKIFNEEVGKLVIQLVNHCEIANKHFPDSLENIEIRRIHLNQAKDCVNQIDIQMALIYDCLLKNPSGAFHSSDEKPLTASDGYQFSCTSGSCVGEVNVNDMFPGIVVSGNVYENLNSLVRYTAGGTLAGIALTSSSAGTLCSYCPPTRQ